MSEGECTQEGQLLRFAVGNGKARSKWHLRQDQYVEMNFDGDPFALQALDIGKSDSGKHNPLLCPGCFSDNMNVLQRFHFVKRGDNAPTIDQDELPHKAKTVDELSSVKLSFFACKLKYREDRPLVTGLEEENADDRERARGKHARLSHFVDLDEPTIGKENFKEQFPEEDYAEMIAKVFDKADKPWLEFVFYYKSKELLEELGIYGPEAAVPEPSTVPVNRIKSSAPARKPARQSERIKGQPLANELRQKIRQKRPARPGFARNGPVKPIKRVRMGSPSPSHRSPSRSVSPYVELFPATQRESLSQQPVSPASSDSILEPSDEEARATSPQNGLEDDILQHQVPQPHSRPDITVALDLSPSPSASSLPSPLLSPGAQADLLDSIDLSLFLPRDARPIASGSFDAARPINIPTQTLSGHNHHSPELKPKPTKRGDSDSKSTIKRETSVRRGIGAKQSIKYELTEEESVIIEAHRRALRASRPVDNKDVILID